MLTDAREAWAIVCDRALHNAPMILLPLLYFVFVRMYFRSFSYWSRKTFFTKTSSMPGVGERWWVRCLGVQMQRAWKVAGKKVIEKWWWKKESWQKWRVRSVGVLMKKWVKLCSWACWRRNRMKCLHSCTHANIRTRSHTYTKFEIWICWYCQKKYSIQSQILNLKQFERDNMWSCRDTTYRNRHTYK